MAQLVPGLLVTLLSLLNFLRQPGIPPTADGLVHYHRAMEMLLLWQRGVLYSPWAPDLAHGYGYPLFAFMPPLLYQLVAAVALPVGLAPAFKLAIVLATVLGVWGVQALVRLRFGDPAGLVAAVAYAFHSARLVEIYDWGNYAQLLAFSLAPWALWSIARAAASPSARRAVLSAVLLALLSLSHNVTWVWLAPFVLLYSVWQVVFRRPSAARRRVALTQLGAWSLAGLLATFFWLPAWYERSFVQLERVLGGPFDFRLHLVPWEELLAASRPTDLAAANLGTTHNLGWAHLGLAVLALLLAPRLPRSRLPEIGYFGLLAAGATFLASPWSRLLWQAVPPLELVLFPFRFVILAGLALSVLAGAVLATVRPARARLLAPALAAVLILAELPGVFTRSHVPLPVPSVAALSSYERQTGTVGTTSAGEYLPVWAPGVPQGTPGMAALSAPVPAAETTVRALYYPGWQVRTLSGAPATLAPQPGTGLLSVRSPEAGRVGFGLTPLRRAATAVSLLGLLLAFGLTLSARAPAPGTAPPDPRPAVALSALLATALVGFMAWPGLAAPFSYQSDPSLGPPGMANRLSVRLDDAVELVGYDLPSPVVPAGRELPLTLYWHALRQIQGDLGPFVHLYARGDRLRPLAQSVYLHPARWYPLRDWGPEFYIQDGHRLEIPDQLPVGAYDLVSGLFDPQTGQRPRTPSGADSVFLEHVFVLPWRDPGPRTRFQPVPRFGPAGIIVEGATLVPEPGRLVVRLYWRAAARPHQDYTVFVHALDASGRRLAQHDSFPAEGRWPTSLWLPGTSVPDEHVLEFAPAGVARLLVGLYDWRTGERLPLWVGGQPAAEAAYPIPVD